MTNQEIKKEFDGLMSIFEINLRDYIETLEADKYTYCHINYNEKTNMLQYGGITNAGFYCENEIEFDKIFSIDQNLESLFELFINDSIKEYQNEN